MLASDEFLRTRAWRALRFDVLMKNDGRCECCGRNKHQLGKGEYLNVDHIKSRRDNPKLALKVQNLQVLCSDCNAGKGNRYSVDFRHPKHPHRER